MASNYFISITQEDAWSDLLPIEFSDPALFLVVAHDQYPGAGRDVVVSRDLGHQPEFESERDDFGIGMERIAAAHGMEM